MQFFSAKTLCILNIKTRARAIEGPTDTEFFCCAIVALDLRYKYLSHHEVRGDRHDSTEDRRYETSGRDLGQLEFEVAAEKLEITVAEDQQRHQNEKANL